MDEAIKLLVIVFVIGGWIVNQLMQSKGGKPQTPPGQKPRPPVAASADDSLTENSSPDDVASFLERARMKAAKQQQGGQRRPDVEVVTPPPFPGQKGRRKQQKAAAKSSEDVNRGRTVAAHVQQHLSSSSIEQSISHLGERVGQADESMASHLNQAFSHQVGRLGGGAQVATANSSPADDEQQRPIAPSAAAEIAALLANPQSARNSVVLSEIFSRPVNRW